MGDPQYGYPDVYNQGYSDNRLGNQPYYPGQPQPPPPQVIYVNNPIQPGDQFCPKCKANTKSYITKGSGHMTWIWCIVLFFFTGILCWIPFVCDRCRQQQIRCQICHSKKGKI